MSPLDGKGAPEGLAFSGRKPKNRRRSLDLIKQSRRHVTDYTLLERRMLPTAFVVSTTTDSGPGSLRQAILDSNSDTAGTNLIGFDIGALGSRQTISPLTTFPTITQSVAIDGWSQGGTGYTGVPLVTINGSTGAIATGLNLAASAPASLVRGLVIDNDSTTGIILLGFFDKVQGNYIGTDSTGTTAGSIRTAVGVEVQGNTQVVGTDCDGTNDLAEGNVISGNATGISIDNPRSERL